VHVAFTDEQELLAKTAEQLAQAVGPQSPAELEGDGDDRWDLLTDAGWLALRVPVEAGGMGASGVEVAIVAEALGRSACREPFLGNALATELLVAAGAAVDDRRTCIALHGVAFDARGATEAVTIAGDRVATVALGDPLPTADLTRVMHRTGDVTADVGPLTREARTRWEAFALAAFAADLVGVMDGALRRAVAHARDRVQFDQPIGSFQAVQHLCADALVTIESARSAMWHAAWAVDELAPEEALMAGRVAKAYASAAAREVCETAIQVFGGIGITGEAMPHVYLRRALLDRALMGDERVHHRFIAEQRLGARA
jgi:alkylation response protein AidB-like acyl-CoA dehydrogenase